MEDQNSVDKIRKLMFVVVSDHGKVACEDFWRRAEGPKTMT